MSAFWWFAIGFVLAFVVVILFAMLSVGGSADAHLRDERQGRRRE